ncbi:hypothetical protein ELY21_00860 [Legionella sp. km535]|uniref:hypothetical protein n=1 Tax=Legionella sp. km535 TaxID=2498107 RepID=UPI000F8EBD66|nr:hypothetical protein [Legionella sp. km535]RUR20667.1 hypothetical protein ELY21_00860 [Legionella sp. km535]
MPFNQTFFNECMEAHRGRAPGYSMECLFADALLQTYHFMKYLTVTLIFLSLAYTIYNHAHIKQTPETEYNRLNTLD